MKKSFYAADSGEMLEPFATAFVLLDALSDRLQHYVPINLSPVLEAVGNRFGDTVDADGCAMGEGLS